MNKTRIKRKRNFKKPEVEKFKPLYKEKPILSLLFFAAVLLIGLSFLSNALIKGGDMFYSVVIPEQIQNIEYIWNGESYMVEGLVVSNTDDTYYISTTEQKLMIIHTSEIRVKPRE